MTETVDWKPLGLFYRVQLTPPETQTAGGIFLPEQDAWRCNDGLLTAIGSGVADAPGRFLFQARLGERVLFERENLEPGPNELEGCIADEDVVAIVTGDGIQPCGEWLLVRLNWQEETEGGVYIPGQHQNRQRFGTVVDYGPGRVIRHGEKAGLRVTCGELLDLAPFADVRGVVVSWKSTAKLLFQPDARDGLYLVKCMDCIGVLEDAVAAEA